MEGGQILAAAGRIAALHRMVETALRLERPPAGMNPRAG